MPQLSRQNSSFGPSSRSSINSVSSAIFDRFRGFGTSTRQKKALEERWRRPLTVRNVETFVEDQRIEECTCNQNRSKPVQIGFWLKELPEAEQEAITETRMAIEKYTLGSDDLRAHALDLPEEGSFSEASLPER